MRDGYHRDNPYHNFYHAMHVVQVRERKIGGDERLLRASLGSRRRGRNLELLCFRCAGTSSPFSNVGKRSSPPSSLGFSSLVSKRLEVGGDAPRSV